MRPASFLLMSEQCSATFGSEKKIKKSEDFLKILRAKGEGVISLHSNWLEVKLVRDLSSKGTKFGFTVGKRFSKRSVDRNLIKRVLRESVRHSFFNRSGIEGIRLVLRLKRQIPLLGKEYPVSDFKNKLRKESDKLLILLTQKIEPSVSEVIND